MHHIMSLKLVSSSFNVVNLSLDGSRKISIKNDNAEAEPSTLDNYAMRNTLAGCCNEISQCSLVECVANYFVVKNEIKKRQKQVFVREFPIPYSNSKGAQYPSFCKYQLTKYKLWNTEVSNTWDNEEVSDEIFCKKWNSFLQTKLGQQLVPDWRRHFTNAEIYFSNESVNDDFEDTTDTNDVSRIGCIWLNLVTHKF